MPSAIAKKKKKRSRSVEDATVPYRLDFKRVSNFKHVPDRVCGTEAKKNLLYLGSISYLPLAELARVASQPPP